MFFGFNKVTSAYVERPDLTLVFDQLNSPPQGQGHGGFTNSLIGRFLTFYFQWICCVLMGLGGLVGCGGDVSSTQLVLMDLFWHKTWMNAGWFWKWTIQRLGLSASSIRHDRADTDSFLWVNSHDNYSNNNTTSFTSPKLKSSKRNLCATSKHRDLLVISSCVKPAWWNRLRFLLWLLLKHRKSLSEAELHYDKQRLLQAWFYPPPPP